MEEGATAQGTQAVSGRWRNQKPEAAELPLAWCRRAQQGSPEDIWSFERVVELKATSERRRGIAWSKSRDSKEGLKGSRAVTAAHLQGRVYSRWDVMWRSSLTDWPRVVSTDWRHRPLYSWRHWSSSQCWWRTPPVPKTKTVLSILFISMVS